MLDALTIDDELVSLSVQQENSSVRSDFLNSEWSVPSRFQFAWEQPKSGVEKQDLVVWFETSRNDPLVMVGLGLLLINFRTLIGKVSYLFKLVDLDHAPLSCWLDVEIEQLNRPCSLVFELHWEMAGLTVDQVIRGCPQRCFVGCSVGPESIVQFKGPVFARGIDSFLKNVLDHPVGNFNLTTRLGMISSS